MSTFSVRIAAVAALVFSLLAGLAQAQQLELKSGDHICIVGNTLAERTVRHRERWRYDEAAKTWWLVSGLPDLWQDD